ncbi:MAG: alcohol dehydrogenase [Dehalococcoidia bacterium]|jgi:S-(hydroxymethyl)glutathione dehydrogenase/alcohol dehydrogenase|nr:MAG: Zn-dependent alcohol dehydrogenase [SAR202 cluster bacterium]MCH2672637.1 Zn-dependent alcohol dehydrogenase [Dehalococcoidia bacterium]GIS93983.1 MAG: alcohol dehydrogenase [Dehalococcoidia bacterium]|tara:strand:+ start:17817 stop:18899 length:1083 start_codon:yes stop_codon:yes gene_type:complete
MKAAVLHEVNQPLQMEEIDVALPGPREVLVRTKASGVCHSDLHFVEGLYTTTMPVVLGHEAAGIVEAIGSQVNYVSPGDRVICCLSVFCGQCERCTTGRPVLCSRTGLVRGQDEAPRLSQGGASVTQFANLGAYAEMMLVHENSLVKIEQDIGFEQMALIGCGATTGLGAAMNTAKVEPGSTVAVIGCGGVGLNAIQGAKLAGALRIIAIDSVEDKLTLAREFGATDVIDASSGDVETKVKDLTKGGVDYSFEAIGKKETAEQSFSILRAGGTATIIGMIPQGVKIELDGASFLRERRIQGSSMGSNHFRVDMPRYVDFYLQGRLKLDELVSRRLTLEDVNEAFKYMKEGSVARSVMMFD